MSNQEPDGWVAWHPLHGWCTGTCAVEYEGCKETHDFFNLDLEAGWQIKPVMLIDPQELSRLRSIAEWAIEASSQLSSAGYQSKIDRDISESLIISYVAITAPEDKEGGFTCCLCGLRIKGRPYHYTDKGDVCVSCFDYEANQ